MKYLVKKLPQKDYADFVNIVVNAYPGFGIRSDKDKESFHKRLLRVNHDDPHVNYYGCYQGKQLLGGIRLFDFTMTMFGAKVAIGGGGLLAVDLMHKKEKVARELMIFFINHFRKKGVTMATLYPFRPDFYKKMGFGYGTKLNGYTIKPGNLPSGGAREKVGYLKKKEWPAMAACYNRFADKTHGMFPVSYTHLRAHET